MNENDTLNQSTIERKRKIEFAKEHVELGRKGRNAMLVNYLTGKSDEKNNIKNIISGFSTEEASKSSKISKEGVFNKNIQLFENAINLP